MDAAMKELRQVWIRRQRQCARRRAMWIALGLIVALLVMIRLLRAI
jgi:hypothetical protein